MLITLAPSFRFRKVVPVQISWLLNAIVKIQHEHTIVIVKSPLSDIH